MDSAAFTRNEIELGNRITHLSQQLREMEQQRDEVGRRYIEQVQECTDMQREIDALKAEIARKALDK